MKRDRRRPGRAATLTFNDADRPLDAQKEWRLTLGYSPYVAQGGDWGAGITTWMGKQRPAELAAIHLNLPVLFAPPPLDGPPTPAEQAALNQLTTYETDGVAYANLQGTRPQTIGYDLADSPADQAAWIYEKLGEWSDSDLDPDRLFGRDRILDDIGLYRFTDTAASSGRLYAESFVTDFVTLDVDIPVGADCRSQVLGVSVRASLGAQVRPTESSRSSRPRCTADDRSAAPSLA